MEVGQEFWGGDGVDMKTEKIMKKMTTIQPSKNLSSILAMGIVSRDRYKQ